MQETSDRGKGWYRSERRQFDDEWLCDKPFNRFAAWQYLIAAACHRPTVLRLSHGQVHLETGQLTASVRFLAERWGWSKTRVTRVIEAFKNRDMLRVESGTGQMVITICNYAQYQGLEEEAGTAPGQQAGRDRDSTGTAPGQSTTTKPLNTSPSENPPKPPKGQSRRRSKKDDDGIRSPEYLAFKADYPLSAHENDFLDWKAWNWLTDDGRKAAAVAAKVFRRKVAGRDPDKIPRAANWIRNREFWALVRRKPEEDTNGGVRADRRPGAGPNDGGAEQPTEDRSGHVGDLLGPCTGGGEGKKRDCAPGRPEPGGCGSAEGLGGVHQVDRRGPERAVFVDPVRAGCTGGAPGTVGYADPMAERDDGRSVGRPGPALGFRDPAPPRDRREVLH